MLAGIRKAVFGELPSSSPPCLHGCVCTSPGCTDSAVRISQSYLILLSGIFAFLVQASFCNLFLKSRDTNIDFNDLETLLNSSIGKIEKRQSFETLAQRFVGGFKKRTLI
jgi:hypothetical protein